MHGLIGKVNRDPQFGKDQEFRQFYNGSNNNNNDSLRSDSGVSTSSSSTQKSNTDSSSIAPKEKTIVDLDLIVEKWISYMWFQTKGKSKYEFEDLDIIVNWAKVDLDQDEAKFETTTKSLHSHAPTTQTLFRTYFTNRTDMEQEYSFKTSRTTRQSCGFSFIKGFSREKEGGVKFKLPEDIIEIGGGIRSEQSVECGKDQTKEEEVCWGVDSMIKVKPHSKTRASLVISELHLERDFTLETRLKGRLLVTLNSRTDTNQFVKSFSGDIVEIIRVAIEKHWMPANASIFEIVDSNSGKYARTLLKGKCNFRLGVEQHVTLDEENV